MSYNDFWFIETRNQKINIRRWFLWTILLFAFVTVGVIFCIKSMYRPMNNYVIEADRPSVTVDEAKQTNANGYIKGSVCNNSEEKIQDKYIKFIFYTKNNVNIGNEYIEIGTLEPNETRTYELKFRYPKVERLNIVISDSKE